MTTKKKMLVGAHISAAKGAYNAIYNAGKYGANVIQLFTANQRRWNSKKITNEEIGLWEKAKRETDITHIMSHTSYLINLGSPKHDMIIKSRNAFKEELHRCHLLNIDYLVFHPGAAVGSTEKECLDKVVESLIDISPLAKKGKTRLLIETTAGQGTNIGYSFEQLGYIIKKTNNKLPIGICIDTCHIFAAGYDITTKKGWDKTLKEFDKIIGLKHLYAFHVNDSFNDLGSRKDRHANLGKGKIGIESFKVLMSDNRTKYIPKYLETPSGDKYWKDEIKLLKKMSGK